MQKIWHGSSYYYMQLDKRAYIVSIESIIRNSLIGAIHHINYLRGT